MKRRVRKIANFLAFNLLFFALYLNFIHKDQSAINGVNQVVTNLEEPAAFGGTTVVITDKPVTQSKSIDVKTEKTPTKEENTALKLSIE